MKDYIEKGKELLSVLTNSGYQAYLIGGVVRSTIMESDFNEIDITTSANPDTVQKCFPNAAIEFADEHSVVLMYAGYRFNISTFRQMDLDKHQTKKVRSHYSKSLEDDLAWRDFTMNAIAMSHGGKLTDAFNGYQDVGKKLIRAIGNAKVRFQDDPIRMIRAFRFVSELGFKIERKTLNALKSKVKHIHDLEVEAITPELKKLIAGEYFKKALRLMRDCNALKHIPVIGKELKRLVNRYTVTNFDTILACTFVKAKEITSEEMLGYAENPAFVKDVTHLALVSPKAKYTKLQLYSNGLDVCLLANRVNVLLGKGKNKAKTIEKQYAALPIHKVCDLAFKGEDIMKLKEDIPTEYIQTIVENMTQKVLEEGLANEVEVLRVFALASLREMGMLAGLEVREGVDDLPEEVTLRKEYVDLQDEFVARESKPIPLQEKVNAAPGVLPVQKDALRSSEEVVEKEYTEFKMDQIERKIYEQEERLRMKDQKILELERQTLKQKMEQDISEIVNQNVDLLKELKYLKKDTEALVVKRELRGVYRSLLKNVDPKLKQISEEKHEEDQ